MTTVFAFLIAAALVAGGIVFAFNKLVALRQHVDAGWSDIDVQLKRRADLIPNIVSAVKAYAAHERTLFEDLTHIRGAALAAGNDPAARAAAEDKLAAGAGRLLAVAEAYPELKASENFLGLQKELSQTEDTIEMARRYYNGTVRNMNTAAQSFPLNLIAAAFGFKHRAYFDLDPSEKGAVNVEL